MIIDKFPQLCALILDLDGVLWRDKIAIGDLPEIFKKIESQNLKVIFATNNATKSISEYVDKMASFGLNVDPSKIVNSAMALGEHLTRRFPNGGNVFVVGQPSLVEVMQKYGFHHVDNPTDHDIIAVIASLDQSISYEKIKTASLLIQEGIPFYGTNTDATYPTPYGLWPGSGTIVRALETASNTKAIIIGKPESALFNMALERLGTRPDQTMVIGDRLETDIAGGQAAKCLVGLVLSGASTAEDVEKWQPKPDIICSTLEELITCPIN